MIGIAANTHGIAETLGVDTTNSTGLTVTAGATANTKGSWVTFGTPSFQYESILVCAAQTAASRKLFDIGVNDGSGNWHVIAGNIAFEGSKSADSIHHFELPLRVKAGQELGIRIQASTASHILIMTITGFSKGHHGAPGYAQIVPLFTSTSSRGVTIDPGATANTKGPWTQLIASTPYPLDSLLFYGGRAGDVSRTNAATALIDIGVGEAGSEYVLVPDIFARWTTTLDGPEIYAGQLNVSVPAGVRLVARAQCTDTVAGDRNLDVCLYGLVK